MFREINDEFTEKVTQYYKHIQMNNNVSNVFSTVRYSMSLFNSHSESL